MRYLVWLAAGFLAYRLSSLVEAWGDSAPAAAMGGISWERLTWHVLALVLLLVGLACFVRAITVAVREIRGDSSRQPSPPSKLVPGAVNADPQSSFDPDAALARYLESARPGPMERAGQSRARADGFGRRA